MESKQQGIIEDCNSIPPNVNIGTWDAVHTFYFIIVQMIRYKIWAQYLCVYDPSSTRPVQTNSNPQKINIIFMKIIIKVNTMSETRWEKNNTRLLFFSFKEIKDSEGKTLVILASVRTEKSINKKSFSCLVEAANNSCHTKQNQQLTIRIIRCHKKQLNVFHKQNWKNEYPNITRYGTK